MIELPASGCDARPPVEPAEERLAERQQRRPAVGRRGVEQQRAALVAVTLAGRPQPLVEQGRGAVDHRAQPLPDGRAQRAAGCLGLDGREQSEFGDEALVVRGQLAADARGEGVADQLVARAAARTSAASARSPGTTGRRSWPRAARPPRR